jgi:hypothetical protein
MNSIKNARNILETSIDAVDGSPTDYTFDELKSLMVEILDNAENDYWLELEGGEVRLIHDDSIDQIWTDALIGQVKECYNLDDIPSFISIDWEQTAENCKVDGMGHCFAGYDHEEHKSGDWNIFRTN